MVIQRKLQIHVQLEFQEYPQVYSLDPFCLRKMVQTFPKNFKFGATGAPPMRRRVSQSARDLTRLVGGRIEIFDFSPCAVFLFREKFMRN